MLVLLLVDSHASADGMTLINPVYSAVRTR